MKLQAIPRLLINALFPQHCLGCKRLDVELCANCLRSIIDPEVLSADSQIQLLTLGRYTTPLLQRAIKQLKFHGQHSIGKPLGEALAATIAKERVIENPDNTLVLPIPLHKKRMQERGYNQAACIAQPIASLLGIEYTDTILARAVSTHRHADMEHAERWKHIRGAFSLRPGAEQQIEGKHMLLVDDVVTTGATALEAAHLLLSQGAKRITICAITRSQ